MLGLGNKRQRYRDPDYSGYAKAQEEAPPQESPQQNGQRAPMEGQGDSPESLEAYISRRNEEIDAQVAEFSRKNPNFDIRRELNNPDFCTYVWGNGLSVEDAYYLVHRNDRQANSAVPERRIAENGTARPGGSGMLKKNPSELSDEEIDDIVRRVRKGEKISF